MRCSLRSTLALTVLATGAATLVACGDDDVTQPELPNPVITSISPLGKFQGEPDFALAVTGKDFIATTSDPVALWNGEPRPTRPIDETGLWVDISAEDLNAPGEAELQVLVFGDTGQAFSSNTVTFKIVAEPVSMTINSPSSSLDVGGKLSLSATALLSDGSTAAVRELAAWSVDELRVARISNSSGSKGQLTGVGSGGTHVYARLFGLMARAQVIVGHLSTLALGPTEIDLSIGESLQLFATGHFSDGAANDLTALAEWTSSDPGVADFTGGEGPSGVLVALASGTTTISATVDGVTTSRVVTVGP